MQEEHNDTISGASELSGSLPVHPFTPKKDAHKKGINIAHVDGDIESSSICGSCFDSYYICNTATAYVNFC